MALNTDKKRAYLTVTEVNEYIKMLFSADRVLSDVYVRGEISNFNNHYKSGHYYFSLKDEESVIGAVMFSSSARMMKFVPENGMKVLVRGSVAAYVRDGRYQIYAKEIVPEGVGELAVAFEQLKNRLASEGLFDSSAKKPLPRFPQKIGIITSETGAAVHDITRIISRRYPCAEMFLYPTLVQGASAPTSLCKGLDFFCMEYPVDVIIIGRGGGSAEDLWAFNDETLARKIASSKTPVISAVGHESDFTICDFVADLRAPTPSAAAELAVPDRNELLSAINALASGAENSVRGKIKHERQYLSMLENSRVLKAPEDIYSAKREALGYFSERLDRATNARYYEAKNQLTSLGARLGAFDPLRAALRGYSTVYNGEGELINSVEKVKTGDDIKISMSDGELTATVTGIKQIRQSTK